MADLQYGRMRKLAFGVLLLLALHACSLLPSSAPPAAVYKKGNALVYDGYLSLEANRRAAELMGGDIRTLVITSRGGPIEAGMALGRLVVERELDVEVGEYCFSSCANYVFPAGRVKLLHRFGQLAWHGGAAQKMNFEGDPQMEALYKAYIPEATSKEVAFFRQIGVSQESTVFGQRPEYERYAKCVGWTYTLEMMARFGIRNIILADGIWEPANTFEGKCIFTIEAENYGMPAGNRAKLARGHLCKPPERNRISCQEIRAE